jgi:hypothetical protein
MSRSHNGFSQHYKLCGLGANLPACPSMTVADASGLLPVYAQTVHIADSPRSGCMFKRRDVDGGVMMLR